MTEQDLFPPLHQPVQYRFRRATNATIGQYTSNAHSAVNEPFTDLLIKNVKIL
jgi:hypothetical protein